MASNINTNAPHPTNATTAEVRANFVTIKSEIEALQSGLANISLTPGATGATGSTGYTGSQGATGFTGSVGATGFDGMRGYTGSQGVPGMDGAQGATGFTGSAGAVGFDGVRGYTGSVGFTGSVGAIGSIGYTGSAGAAGAQGSVGYTGSVGAIGFTGSASTVAGYTGSVGATGYTGSAPTAFAWSAVTGKPTTVSGYGITDAVDTSTTQSVGGAKTFTSGVTAPTVTTTVNGSGGVVINDRATANNSYTEYVSSNTLTWYSQTAAASRATLDASGNFTAVGNVSAYSDERLKQDWSDVDANLVTKLAGVKSGAYTRVDTNERQVGVSAQSMRDVLPEAVNEDSEGMLSVAYGNAALVAVIALAKEVVELRSKVAELSK